MYCVPSTLHFGPEAASLTVERVHTLYDTVVLVDLSRSLYCVCLDDHFHVLFSICVLGGFFIVFFPIVTVCCFRYQLFQFCITFVCFLNLFLEVKKKSCCLMFEGWIPWFIMLSRCIISCQVKDFH